jgi:hypothetical protein
MIDQLPDDDEAYVSPNESTDPEDFEIPHVEGESSDDGEMSEEESSRIKNKVPKVLPLANSFQCVPLSKNKVPKVLPLANGFQCVPLSITIVTSWSRIFLLRNIAVKCLFRREMPLIIVTYPFQQILIEALANMLGIRCRPP